MKRITGKLLSLGLAASMLISLDGVQVYADTISDAAAEPVAVTEHTGGLYIGDLYDINGNLIEFDLIPEEPVDELYESPSGASASDSYFNLYDVNRINKTVEDQAASETCWAHATLGSAESSMITQGLASSTINYSEAHLVWFAQGAGPADVTDPMYGDNSFEYGTNAYLQPASILTPIGALARGSGVQLESNAGHSYIYNRTAVPESQRYVSHGLLKDALIYDGKDITSIKNALVKYGACYLGFYSNSAYLNPETGAYFSNGAGGGHGVTLIGWDDNYSRLNFNASCRPTSNGAWIIKNSYGTSYANSGYMYISYEDVLTNVASFIMTDRESHTHIYQHDGGAGMYDNGDGTVGMNAAYEQNLTSANVFTAKDNSPLTAVSFYTMNSDVDYTISIITGMTGNDPSTGKIVHTQSGTQKYMGYHTVDLSKQIALTKGSKFAIAVTMDEYHLFDCYSLSETNSYCTVGKPSTSTEWYTVKEGLGANINACIKAFTGAAPLTAPTITDVETTGSSVKLTWNAVSGATSYRIYRADTATGVKKLLKTVSNTYTTDATVTAGRKYYYFVAAYSSKTSELGPYSAAKHVTALSVPSISSVTATSSSVNLKWNAISGATSYRLYRADSATGTKTLLKTVGNPYTSDTTVTAGNKYYYYIVAYDSSTATRSAYSATKYVTAIATPVITSATITNNSVKLTWNAVKGATSYRVYRADTAAGTKTLLKTVGNAYTTDTTVTTGKTYYYFIAAYDSGTATLSGYSASKAATLLATPVISSAVTSGNYAKLTWNAISGATSYRLYRANSVTGTKTMIKSVGNTYTTDTTATPGTLYYYYVAAYNSVSGTQSAYSAVKAAVAGKLDNLSTPVIKTLTVSGTNSVSLTWNAVANATSYRLYRAESINGTKKLIKTVGNAYTTDTTATAGKSYYYFVQAYCSPCNVSSAYSATKAVTLFNTPVITSTSIVDDTTVKITWNPVSEATSYRVYRATSETGAKTLIKTVGNAFTTDATVDKGITYYYFIAAYNSSTATLSKYSASKAAITMEAPSITSSASGGYPTCKINVYSSVVSGATHYYLYRSATKDGEKTFIASSTTECISDSTVTAGNSYYYYVAAYNSAADMMVYSEPELCMAIGGINPSSIGMDEKSRTSALIDWNACEGATYYDIYRMDEDVGVVGKLATVSTNSYLDQSLSANHSYYYYIKPGNSSTQTQGILVSTYTTYMFTGIGFIYGADSEIESDDTLMTA